MKRLTTAALLVCLPLAPVAAEDLDKQVKEAKGVMMGFMKELKGELKSAMKEGGPVNAIEVCNTVAPGIAKKQSEQSGWAVGRTSLKVRNPDNAPDAWEREVLNRFEARKAEGEPAKKLMHAEVVEQDGQKRVRVMKAIPTGKVCLKCHGTDIDPKVKAKLDELYPQDKARGFNKGDIRGAFTLSKPM
ncbi:MAG TPA: DUF3365 domain-containing protein [Gammaproteobacteria bacterium]|nr:DUF3365 domain-containing protein [Gammaproteobacteria bacterium]